jgi:hypothetical protein
MSEKPMTLEEVAIDMNNVIDFGRNQSIVALCGSWLPAIRVHRCEPDPAKWVSVEKVREKLSKWRNGNGGIPILEIEAILPKPEDPLAELEAWITNRLAGDDPERARGLALVRKAREARK